MKSCTLEFLNKKHLNFGQGLEFLKFGQGNRGLNQQNRRKTMETIRKSKGKRRKIVKKNRRRDPYFLLNNFLLHIFSVLVNFLFSVITRHHDRILTLHCGSFFPFKSPRSSQTDQVPQIDLCTLFVSDIFLPEEITNTSC